LHIQPVNYYVKHGNQFSQFGLYVHAGKVTPWVVEVTARKCLVYVTAPQFFGQSLLEKFACDQIVTSLIAD
jgi:hypothetical protein